MQIDSANYPSVDGQLRFRVRFRPDDLHLEYSLIGVVVRLAGCPTAGQPGGPALPSRLVRIALPQGTRVARVEATSEQSIRLSEKPLLLAPLQPTRPGVAKAAEPAAYRRPREVIGKRCQQPPGHGCGPVAGVNPFPMPAYVPADPALFAEAAQRSRAVLGAAVEAGHTPIVSVTLYPVRLLAGGQLEFSPVIDLVVYYEITDRQQDRATPRHIVSRTQAMRDVALTSLTVINPDLVIDYSDRFPIDFLGQVDYLIICDNQTWDAAAIAPTGPAGGDIAASFTALARWKRARGLRTRVVTIGDIVAGRYGDFRSHSRDLQEVIRKFLKLATADWGVSWVLLGGDTAIVPVRRVAGGREGNINRQATNPPPDNSAFWTGSHLRLHVVNPGVWWGASTDNLLVRPDNGLLIPYDPVGASSATQRGWYFTADENYATRVPMPTDFVRVNGPETDINADLQFLYEWNTIPTDLYYASLVGSQYDQPGHHDWDLSGNGIYGQSSSASDHDGINYTPSVSVGRAPVNTAAEADAFVAKVIAYEKLQRPDGSPLDLAWTKRVVLVSENWGGRLWISATGGSPPEDNCFHHSGGVAHSLIKLASVPDWNWSLLAYITESDVRLLPYRTDAAAAGRGWHFARSATDLSANIQTVALPDRLLLVPLPSPWIVVFGAPEELAPSGYIFNQTELDSSVADQEMLRTLMLASLRGFNQRQRLYEDIQDMSPAQLAGDPVALISSDGLRAALNAGPHIVSLSGHGSANGCCKLDTWLADSLTNGFHSFITYADSCLTNQFDADAMSEHLLRNAAGGGVAYIGNSRFSWISVGDDFQRRFFAEWASLGGNAHLGLLADTRASVMDGFWWADGRWAVLSLNLMGDPEMPLWWNEPFKFRTEEVVTLDKFTLLIGPNPPDPPFDIARPYRANWGRTNVHLQQGEVEQSMAFSGERLEAALSGFSAGPATLTVTRAGHKPTVKRIIIGGGGEPGLIASLLAVGALLLGLGWLAARAGHTDERA